MREPDFSEQEWKKVSQRPSETKKRNMLGQQLESSENFLLRLSDRRSERVVFALRAIFHRIACAADGRCPNPWINTDPPSAPNGADPLIHRDHRQIHANWIGELARLIFAAIPCIYFSQCLTIWQSRRQCGVATLRSKIACDAGKQF